MKTISVLTLAITLKDENTREIKDENFTAISQSQDIITIKLISMDVLVFMLYTQNLTWIPCKSSATEQSQRT